MDSFEDFNGLYEAVNYVSNFPIPAENFNIDTLPTELRAQVIETYLIGEVELRRDGTLCSAMHYDNFAMPCCVWNWPHQLILCDQDSEEKLPDIEQPAFVPSLARTNQQMRGEVLLQMLNTTAMVTLKYYHLKNAKIAIWLPDFLRSFPGNEGFNAIKGLNLPHIHWYNHNQVVPAGTPNPDMELMLQLPKLCRLRLTFHWEKVNLHNCEEDVWEPITLEAFLNKFGLPRMLECHGLEEIYIGGIFDTSANLRGDPLQALRDFGKWLREGFARKTPKQDVVVLLFPRTGTFMGWAQGQAL